MPKYKDISKVLVIGSGPIIIGQAAEFDYSGTQACKSLKEEGVQVVLVNNNPATIMTDTDIADIVYIENPTVSVVEKIIAKEKPDGILATLGGQTGLNLAVKLKEEGILDKYNVKLLGTSFESIKTAEDRELFKRKMQEIREPVAESITVTNVEDALKFAKNYGYPLIIRPAYTLGGTGGGIAHNDEELISIVDLGLKKSMAQEVLVEKSLYGWKEIEFEVMRDAADNCITICSMENFDPVGVHTGDSIVVAPVQTLSDYEYQMLRSASIKIIKALKIEGGCNIQFALDPQSHKYYVIEVNPRVSRSSALASKATGYPIAKVAAKIAIGLRLDEIKNPVTGKTTAFFEPALDYVVTKIPRWPFDKFYTTDRKIGTQMKATGEVMAIERSFEASLLKAVRSLEIKAYGLRLNNIKGMKTEEILKGISVPNDMRLFYIAEALRRDIDIDYINDVTKIDKWFLNKLLNIINMEREIEKNELREEILKKAKRMGFSDREIATIKGIKEEDVRALRKEYSIYPSYKMVDTCAAEFESVTQYIYSTYGEEDEVETHDIPKVIVIGSGPIRIGQGIEFDYCSVKALWALRDAGIKSIIINNNPETVSTDFDTGDRLYFEPITLEDVLNIYEKEKPLGVMVMFGGQTAINLTEELVKNGVKILGTSHESIDISEDREKFSKLLKELNINQPKGEYALTVGDAKDIALKLGFPLLVRPSYVIGGQSMEKVNTLQEIIDYVSNATQVSPGKPVLIDKYIDGREVEVDAVSDGECVLIPGIMEHIERAGVHSGDSFSIYPARNLSEREINTIIEYTEKISKALNVKGLINIQFAVKEGTVYVLEVNPRASRTVPIMSKATGIPMVKLAVEVALGKRLKELSYKGGLWPQTPYTVVKAPVFSMEKLTDVEVSLSPEMKSTGEIMGIDLSYEGALYKALEGAGLKIPKKGKILLSIAERDFQEAVSLVEKLQGLGYEIYATYRTGKYLSLMGIHVNIMSLDNAIKLLKDGYFDAVVNTPTKGKKPDNTGFKLRRTSVEYRIPLFTSIDTIKAALNAVSKVNINGLSILSVNEYQEIQKDNVKNLVL
ncbi:carbamoyl-phosphate synthase large subunit [Thermoanaerobacter thermohydrosulfuricus]|uniref:Carbamoyl phosphate synthase large chain n=1 Tax=Thermoanaerobacter thermohydrosulfuricus TaxID=1516 RepID=A0A1G7IF69_THETY|nr:MULTISPECIES: carbamoyl-phosphate synthase (glutamine-hydrolyzing) large subunit [Thermoanaerobacter]SDF11367.1 carbamoyl-phosphate synthase large subunit [Thermoanaerobacter thermohydrosulfuricus]SFE15115.1 carbamoyl-phosphate synthase large subunit [Thermoanaerobacter thermohydrosulfuricus]